MGKIFITSLLRTALPCSLSRIPRKARGKYFNTYYIDFCLNSVVTFLPFSNLETPVHRSEAVARRCSVKKVVLKILKIHRKTPVPEFLFNEVAG